MTTLPTLTPCPSCIAPEAWRAVPGYESAYEASTHGRVRSIRRVVDPATGRRGGGRVLKPTPNPKRGGYLYVSLCSGDSGRNMSLHRVVCVTFHGPRPVGHVTRHLDGDPNHNCPSNLVYGTPAENAEDMRRHGTNAASRRTHCPQGHEYDTQNTRWTADGHRDCLSHARVAPDQPVGFAS